MYRGSEKPKRLVLKINHLKHQMEEYLEPYLDRLQLDVIKHTDELFKELLLQALDVISNGPNVLKHTLNDERYLEVTEIYDFCELLGLKTPIVRTVGKIILMDVLDQIQKLNLDLENTAFSLRDVSGTIAIIYLYREY